MRKPVLATLVLLIAGCGLSPKAKLWYHPQRTLEQAKQDIERCYDEAFLAEQGGCYTPGAAYDKMETLMYVEVSARQCMIQAGYNRISPEEADRAAQKYTGAVHGVTYFIAGK